MRSASHRAGRRQEGGGSRKRKTHADLFVDEELGIFRTHRFQQARTLFDGGQFREIERDEDDQRQKGSGSEDETTNDEYFSIESLETLESSCGSSPSNRFSPRSPAGEDVSVSGIHEADDRERAPLNPTLAEKSSSVRNGIASRIISYFSRLMPEEGIEKIESAEVVEPIFPPLVHSGSMFSYSSFGQESKSIRFQVILWHVGRLDEVLGRVDMKFRVTIFWNASPINVNEQSAGYGGTDPFNRRVWTMYGRQRAYQRELAEVSKRNALVYVPPVSILNAVNFDILDGPEVCLIEPSTNLMRWSCLYRADLLQEDINVAEYPHDSHNLILRLGILKHRQSRKRWDKNIWKLDLATVTDVQDSMESPHGSIVDHVVVPGFQYRKDDLQFEFLPLSLDSQAQVRDECLQIKLKVHRESSYYDRNIIPLLAALNLVAISTLTLDPSYFGARGEMILATAFVEIGIRLTVDSRLPIVGYQIKIQNMLDHSFYGLLVLVLESSFAYWLQYQNLFKYAAIVDQAAAVIEIIHLACVLSIYYRGCVSRHLRE